MACVFHTNIPGTIVMYRLLYMNSYIHIFIIVIHTLYYYHNHVVSL